MPGMKHLEADDDSELGIFGGAPVRPHPIETNVIVSDRAREQVMALLETGRLSDYYNGPWARKFEEAFASYHGSDFRGIAVNSGTSALHLALTAAGIGPSDEVIVPALCFVAAAIAIVQNGAIPVICDAEPKSLTLDIAQAERLIGPRTKAILPVHFWGYPSDLRALRSLCDRHGLMLIEDCAQALGAPVDNTRVGAVGDYATYAFSVRKHVACGEGGMLLCRSQESYDRLRSLSNYGKGPGWDDYLSLGFSYRMAEFPAIIALDQLSRLDSEIEARQQAGRYYRQLFREGPLAVVPEPAWGQSVYFKCPLLLPPAMTGVRNEIVKAIAAENVSCRVPHRPLYSIPWVSEYLKARGVCRGPEQCPVAAASHQRLIEIETGPHLPLEEAHLSGAAVLKVWRHFSALVPA
jgi:perosamine synthetase